MNIENNIKIIKLDNMGRGIGYINNKIVFVNNTLPNEIVDVEIIKDKKKYYIANVVNYIKKSNDRIAVNCPYYNKCGGCCLLHLNYENYIDYKKSNLINIIKKYSNIDVNPIIIKNKNRFNYRNKVSLKILNGEWGYYNETTHNFVSISECLLANNQINEVIKNKDLFNIKNGNIIIRSNNENKLLINIKSDNKINIGKLIDKFNIIGIILNDKVIYGESNLEETINSLSFKINYNSFFQINEYILSKVFDILNEEISDGNILDLYCGVGVLGLSIAKKVKNVVGIEINENSITDAMYNSKSNNLRNTEYYVGDTKKIINDFDEVFDSIIIDPPRSGLDKHTIQYVMNCNSKSIIYMSCDEITLSRDLNILKEKYVVNKIYLLDMFSNTKHVECVCVLKLR